MQIRIAFCVMSLVIASPAWAQETLPTTVQPQRVVPDPNQEAIKHQVTNFESALRNAVNLGAEQLARELRRIVPALDGLSWDSDLAVSGWWSPDDGYTFHVMIPTLSPTFSLLVARIQQQPPAVTGAPTMNASRTGPGRTSAAATVAKDDPVLASSVVPFEPDKVFSDRVRQALIDALVDNSGALPVHAGQRVRIVAHPGSDLMPNPFGGDSHKLILTVSGDDLLAFRKDQIKREQLLAKIKEERF